MPATIAWLIFLPLALLCATPPARWVFAGIGRLLDRIGRVPGGAEGFVFAVALLVGAMPTMLDAVPPPSTHDEFAYLLAADTFLQGRLANPTPELWEHFETFHQIMQPTYASKFPPAQGAALAAGRLLGDAIIGAWGVVAIACAAICWMLRALLPARWAILGGIVAATHPLIFWWGQIYWGGGVALLGGALIGGALLRTLESPQVRWGILVGIGLAILANSRPFEGALVSAMMLSVVVIRAFRGAWLKLLMRRLVIPMALVLAPVGMWMMYYNWRVTGGPLTMPYVVHARQYMMSPLLWFQSPPPKPDYRHAKLRHYYELHEHHEYAVQRSPAGFLRGMGSKTYTIISDLFAPPTLVVALLGVPWLLLGRARGDDRMRLRRGGRIALALCLAFPLAHMLLTPWFRIQYFAPVLGFFFILVAASMRQMWGWRSGGLAFGAGVVGAILMLQIVAIVWMIDEMVHNQRPTGHARAQLVAERMAMPGEHLVLVNYAPGPQSLFEWVYNNADIDGSKIIFARHIDEPSTQRLLERYPGRRVWLLHVQGLRYDVREYNDLPE